jgi:hypothetical protein
MVAGHRDEFGGIARHHGIHQFRRGRHGRHERQAGQLAAQLAQQVQFAHAHDRPVRFPALQRLEYHTPEVGDQHVELTEDDTGRTLGLVIKAGETLLNHHHVPPPQHHNAPRLGRRMMGCTHDNAAV